MTESASVVAARQLAEEARARRADGVPGAARWPRGRRPRHGRRFLGALVAVGAVTTAGCGVGVACSAVGFSSTLVVQLDGWPAGAGRQVELTCSGCSDPANGVPGPAQILPIGTEVAFSLYGVQPDRATVRVVEDDVVVAEVTAEPEFVRVDGTAECGGNTRAEVVVPAP